MSLPMRLHALRIIKTLRMAGFLNLYGAGMDQTVRGKFVDDSSHVQRLLQKTINFEPLVLWSSWSRSWTSMNVASGLELLMAKGHTEGYPSPSKKRTIDIHSKEIIHQSSFHWTKSPGRQVNQEPMKFHPFYTGWLETGFPKGSICIYSMKNSIIPNVAWKKNQMEPKYGGLEKNFPTFNWVSF